MKVTVFTGNQPRHISLINKLSASFDEVCAVVECTTVFPGQTDDFYKKSEIMRLYFSKMLNAERSVFKADVGINKIKLLKPIKLGDLNNIELSDLDVYLNSDVYIVFGASYIKGSLCDFLIKNHALNIHMGVSPFYRGSGCNFWSLYDENPRLVGGTIHKLSRGLDSGEIIKLAFPAYDESTDGFELGMRAVESAQNCIIDLIAKNSVRSLAGVPQDKNLEIRYSRYIDFTDECVFDYMNNKNLSSNELYQKIKNSYVDFRGIPCFNLM